MEKALFDKKINSIHYTTHPDTGEIAGWDYVIFDDGSKAGRKVVAREFVNLFKNKLRPIIAGETINPEEYYKFLVSKATPHSLEQHLKTVEAKARVNTMGFQKLTTRQKVAIGTIVILMLFSFVGLVILKGAGILSF